ncbi:MAG: hypothetical protein WCF95_03840 [bacterium]
MQNHTLLIVGDNKELILDIKQKADLKRDLDKILDTGLKRFSSVLKNCKPDTILFLVDEPDDEILKAIEQIKKMPHLFTVPVMFFIEKKYNKEFMQKALKVGLDDFIYCPIDETEISIRIKMNLKRNSYSQSIENQKTLLKKFNVIDENNFYMPEFANNIFDAFAKNALEYNDSFVFMLFSSLSENKDKLLEQLKLYSRSNDATGQLSGNIFYSIMPKTSLEKAKDFYKKIKESMEESELTAAVCKYSAKISYKDLTTMALKALKEASSLGNVLVNVDYLGAETFLAEVTQKKEKNYKLFQKVFDKKTQIIVLPTFQHLKMHLEQKYPYNVKINFYVMDTKCYFSLQHIPTKFEVAFKINNLGHSKVAFETIYTNHEQKTTNSMDFDINEINDKIIAKFINIITKEFDKSIN